MSNLESGNPKPGSPRTNFSHGFPTWRPGSLLAAGALAALLTVSSPLRAQDFGISVPSSPMGQMTQMAIGQQYQLSPDPDNPENPPQFQPVPNGDSDDSSMNSDDNDNDADDNADNSDNDQNQNDDNSDNSPDNSASDDNSPPPPPSN
jgi:hypothetical protein